MSASRQNPRRAILARVHIARKEMRLAEEPYRDVLTRIAGKSSAADCSDAELSKVLDEFKRLGWKPKTGRPISQNPQVRLIYAIWGDMKKLLDNAGGDELRSFVQRQTKDDLHPDGVTAPEFLDPVAANKVIEGLKGWRDRLRRRNAA